MLLGNPRSDLWLTQFAVGTELELARQLLSELKLVTFDELSRRLLAALASYPARERIALFIEREIPHRWVIQNRSVVTWRFRPNRQRVGTRLLRNRQLVPVRMYKERPVSRGRGLPKKLRATGAALAPVDAPRRDRQEIGSEGILSTIAGLAARGRRNIHVHPSAEVVRDKKIGHFIVLTDFIGSGTRITDVLDSLWRVRSVRSWRSGGLIKFSVLSYSGTQPGIEHVRSHSCAPDVEVLVKCPTLQSAFDAGTSRKLTDLCTTKAGTSERPLGYGDIGALIAFQHSCPNNVPAIFTESRSSRRDPWHALFPDRSTEAVYEHVAHLQRSERDRLALEAMGLASVASKSAFLRASEASRNMILVLAALLRRHRDLDELATITFLNLCEIGAAIDLALEQGYLDQPLRLSADGLALLRRLARPRRSTEAATEQCVYYPKSLRVPV